MSAIELNALWDAAHPHLKPSESALTLKDEQYHACPICGHDHAMDLTVQAQVMRPNGTEQSIRTSITWCPSCSKYSVDTQAWAHTCQQNGLDAAARPVALNARLWSTGPTFLNIEPTTRCNFSCWYCVGRYMEQRDIEVEDFEKVLDHFPTVRAIALVGEGEPLMHKGFFDMAKMASSRGIKVLTISNGSTFSTSNVAKLCESGVSYVSISIDSINPATFASSRIDGDLEQVLKGIQRLARYRDDNGFKYPRIGLKGTLFTHTENELVPIVEMAKAHGVDVFESFQPLNPMSTYVPIYPKAQLEQLASVPRVSQAINRDMEKARHMLKPATQFCDEEGIRIDKNGTPNGLRANCDEEWIYSLLSGDITPCCQIKNPPSPNWNLSKRPLIDILRDADYENTRFNLWNGLFPQYCKGCWKIA